ncbi:MAG: RNA polymerase sigma factor [Actinomycetes bacterium]
MSDAVHARIEAIYREEYGRVVASLARRFSDLDIAEDAAGEALVTALEKWPVDGIPPNPGGWLTTTAGNRAIDKIRRENLRDAKFQAAEMIRDDSPHEPTGVVEDDRLRLMFTCCHPALAPEARMALTLRMLGGLTVEEIARAFLVAETTMAQRITRAKAKIKKANIPFTVPQPDDLSDRIDAVLAVLFLVFNEGYLSGGEEPIRAELSDEAIRLSRILCQLLPDEPEPTGLLALMLLTDARRDARIANGELVTFSEQDRAGWDAARIREGHALAMAAMEPGVPGPYVLMAAISTLHTAAPSAGDTDWARIATLYDRLYALSPTPVVALNRAVAIAELDGPQVALALVDDLNLTGYHAWHATRADLLHRLGRSDEARDAYDAAIAATENPAERAYLERRRGQLA